MTASSPPAAVSHWSTLRGGLVSLAFWVCLIAAALMFAAVSLAPKLVAWRTLQGQFRSQQTRLLALERQTEQLDRVVDALDHDPQFSAEIARLEFDAVRPGEEVLAVDVSLSLNPIARDDHATHAATITADPWLPWLQTLATQEKLRIGLLASAACIVLLAFTFLHEGLEAPDPAAHPTDSWWKRATARYHAS